MHRLFFSFLFSPPRLPWFYFGTFLPDANRLLTPSGDDFSTNHGPLPVRWNSIDLIGFTHFRCGLLFLLINCNLTRINNWPCQAITWLKGLAPLKQFFQIQQWKLLFRGCLNLLDCLLMFCLKVFARWSNSTNLAMKTVVRVHFCNSDYLHSIWPEVLIRWEIRSWKLSCYVIVLIDSIRQLCALQ